MLSIFKRKRASKDSQKALKSPRKLRLNKTISHTNSSKLLKTRKISKPAPLTTRPKRKKLWLEEVIGFEGMDRAANLDDFTMVKPLGKGSFGKVIAISSKSTSKQYAMKILSKKMLMKYKMVKQIMNEIKIMRSMTHENIIRYQTHFEDKEYIFLLLELADKGHLFSKLKKKGIFNEQEAAKIMFETLKAVSYLHNQEPPIIHRDIKPENILFVGNTVKLADFGWSNTRDIIRSTYCGTRDYLAPEMLLKKGHDEKLDIWTLGVLMYEICTGKTPFSPTGVNKRPDAVRTELENCILKAEPKFPNFLSMNGRDLIQQFLKKNPKDRPTCCESLKHPWFRTNGFRYNSEKERVLYNIISKSKKQLNRKKIRRLLSQEKKVDSKLTRRLNKTDTFNFVTHDKKDAKEKKKKEGKTQFQNLKDKIAKRNKLKKKKKNLSIDEMTSKAVKEYSGKNPIQAIEELCVKYIIAKEEKSQLSKVINLKSNHIKDLEEEINELKSKVHYKKNGESYSKSEILFMEGQTKMSQMTQKRIEELEGKFDDVVKENSMLLRESREFRKSGNSNYSSRFELKTDIRMDFNNVKDLLEELNLKLENKNLGQEMAVVNQETSSNEDEMILEKVNILGLAIEDIINKSHRGISVENQYLNKENEDLKEQVESLELKIKLRGFKSGNVSNRDEKEREYLDQIKELKMKLEMKDKELGYVKRSLDQANNIIEIMHKSQR